MELEGGGCKRRWAAPGEEKQILTTRQGLGFRFNEVLQCISCMVVYVFEVNGEPTQMSEFFNRMKSKWSLFHAAKCYNPMIHFFYLWSFAGLLVLSSWQLDEYLTWKWVAKHIVFIFFQQLLSFSPLHCETLKSIIVKSRDSCWEHGLPVVKCSLKCFKIAIYPLNRNLLCSFLKWGFQGPCDICCACRDST